MKKELKDYLHLYLGCDCLVQGQEGRHKLTGISYDDTQRIWWCYFENTEFGYAHINDVAPILRPLIDITEDEAIEVFKQCSNFDLSECQFEFGENYTTWVNANFEGRVIDSINFVGDNVEMMNNDGTYSPLNPIAPIHHYYLSNHFDLFGLIESGFAIDYGKYVGP